MKYCGCGCQHSCGYLRMRGAGTPLILLLYIEAENFIELNEKS